MKLPRIGIGQGIVLGVLGISLYEGFRRREPVAGLVAAGSIIGLVISLYEERSPKENKNVVRV